MPYVTPQQCQNHIKDLLIANTVELGLEFVGDGAERLVPKYPAVLVDAAPLQRYLHATHRFGLRMFVVLWVYHAKLSVTHAARTQDDLTLVQQITALLHTDFTLGNNIIFGFVESETPGAINRSNVRETVVGTRMAWVGENQEVF